MLGCRGGGAGGHGPSRQRLSLLFFRVWSVSPLDSQAVARDVRIIHHGGAQPSPRISNAVFIQSLAAPTAARESEV